MIILRDKYFAEQKKEEKGMKRSTLNAIVGGTASGIAGGIIGESAGNFLGKRKAGKVGVEYNNIERNYIDDLRNSFKVGEGTPFEMELNGFFATKPDQLGPDTEGVNKAVSELNKNDSTHFGRKADYKEAKKNIEEYRKAIEQFKKEHENLSKEEFEKLIGRAYKNDHKEYIKKSIDLAKKRADLAEKMLKAEKGILPKSIIGGVVGAGALGTYGAWRGKHIKTRDKNKDSE